MITVKLTTSFPDFMRNRQTPGGSGKWEDCQFFVDQDIPEADFWVVYDNLPGTRQETLMRQDGAIYFGGEPPAVRRYRSRFLKQFDTVVTCQQVDVPKTINTQPALPWQIGLVGDYVPGGLRQTRVRFDYDHFHNLEYFEKRRLISVIASSKTTTRGHVERLRFLDVLKLHFGQRLDVFGGGINPVQDKWEALAPYQYHICLENCAYPNYWTEKLADAYLAWTYPIYYGCPNLGDYFSKGSFTAIDMAEPEKAIRIIEETIARAPGETEISALAEARRRVLDEYNLFAVAAKFCQDKSRSPSPTGRKIILNESQFRRSLVVRRRLNQVWHSWLRDKA